jgi:hypothetical protein
MAVNAAAQMKKASKPINIHAIPLMRRLFFIVAGADTAPGIIVVGPLPKCIVSVYSAKPSPNRNPQLRQKRSSAGIGEWQFEQVVTFGVATGIGISGFCDIGHHRFLVLGEEYTTLGIRQMTFCSCIGAPSG